MANTAITFYTIVQIDEQNDELSKLYKAMSHLEKLKAHNFEKNDGGAKWLGHLFSYFGGNLEKINCRRC